jgi:hypothetical protein
VETGETEPAPAGPTAPLTAVLDAFFVSGSAPGTRLSAPRTAPDALLDQVPEFTVTVRGERVIDLLRPVYRALDGRD